MPSSLARAATAVGEVKLGTDFPDAPAALAAAAALDPLPGTLLAADGDLAGPPTAADGDGLPDGEPEPEAKAAAGTTTAAATTPVTSTRRMGTDMPRSFIHGMHDSPTAAPKSNRLVTLKQPRRLEGNTQQRVDGLPRTRGQHRGVRRLPAAG